MSVKLFRYAGSKTKYLNKILPMIDVDKNLIEPFMGSAAVTLNANVKNKSAYDLNPYVIDIFNGFKECDYEYYLNFIHSMNFNKNCKDSYYNFRDHYNSIYDSLDIRDKAIYQWVCIQCCTNGMARWGKSGFNQGFGSRTYKLLSKLQFIKIKESLSETNIECSDFFDLIKLDNKNVCWFLDPPYLTNSVSYVENFGQEHADKFINTILEFKGDVIYTDTLNSYNQKLLDSGWNIIKLDKLWSTSTTKRTEDENIFEYIFYNFEFKQNLLLDWDY